MVHEAMARIEVLNHAPCSKAEHIIHSAHATAIRKYMYISHPQAQYCLARVHIIKAHNRIKHSVPTDAIDF